MVANVIQANYDTLDKLTKDFEKIYNLNVNMTRTVRTYATTLCQDGWKGEAASQFEAEMQTDVLPRLDRLCEALEMAAQVTNAVSTLIREAEEQASALFR